MVILYFDFVKLFPNLSCKVVFNSHGEQQQKTNYDLSQHFEVSILML